jgi:predicted nucleotidyltransferase
VANDTITKGTNWEVTGYWYNADDSRRNITGATMRFEVKLKENGTTLLTKDNDTNGGLTLSDAEQGEWTVTGDLEDLDFLEKDRDLYCSLWLEEASGEVSADEIRVKGKVL